MTANVKPISMDLIRTDGGTQMRAELDKDVYLDYRDKWTAGVEFDPVDLFHDGSTYWLADGFHRFYGAKEAKRSSIPSKIHQGTQRDAMLFAAGANSAHGLRRSNADKRQAVTTLLNDDEWVSWSDRKIAEQAAVSVQLVCETRKQLSTVDSSPAAKAADQPRLGKDGKSRKPRRPPMASPKKREPGEDPTEKRHKPAPSEPVEPKPTDKSGNALPDRLELLKAFSSRDLFVSSEKARNVIYNNVYEIAKLIPDGKTLTEAVDKHMKALFHTLGSFEPAYVCKSCNGGKCVKCHKRGYTCSK